ncbi:unnamed protein product [Cochlearia groenlandica]
MKRVKSYRFVVSVIRTSEAISIATNRYSTPILRDHQPVEVEEEEEYTYAYVEEDEEEPTRSFAFLKRTDEAPLVRDTKKLPSPRELYDALMESKFEPSFFPDQETLTKLGILDEVRMIIGNMGIGDTLGMSHDVYQEKTCMFLATLEVVLDDRGSQEWQNTGGGSIRVTGANGVTHRATFRG